MLERIISLETAMARLKAARAEELRPFAKGLEALAKRARPAVRDALASAAGADSTGRSEAAPEGPLARFQTQYESLPRGNILAEGSTWETVQARLSDPKNADKLKKVKKELQGGGRLYAVMEDGSLEFMDDHSEQPPRLVKDALTGKLEIFFDWTEERAQDLLLQRFGHLSILFAKIQEMLDWAEVNGFEVFEVDTEDERRFGKLMKLAEAASPNRLFIGKRRMPTTVATALKDAWSASFDPRFSDQVCVDPPDPRAAHDELGLLRRLRI